MHGSQSGGRGLGTGRALEEGGKRGTRVSSGKLGGTESRKGSEVDSEWAWRSMDGERVRAGVERSNSVTKDEFSHKDKLLRERE